MRKFPLTTKNKTTNYSSATISTGILVSKPSTHIDPTRRATTRHWIFAKKLLDKPFTPNHKRNNSQMYHMSEVDTCCIHAVNGTVAIRKGDNRRTICQDRSRLRWRFHNITHGWSSYSRNHTTNGKCMVLYFRMFSQQGCPCGSFMRSNCAGVLSCL